MQPILRPSDEMQAARPVRSDWSVVEQQKFRQLVTQYGRDYKLIAKSMGTKTALMVEQYFMRQVGGVVESENLAKKAKRTRLNGEYLGELPTPTAQKRTKYNTTSSKNSQPTIARAHANESEENERSWRKVKRWNAPPETRRDPHLVIIDSISTRQSLSNASSISPEQNKNVADLSLLGERSLYSIQSQASLMSLAPAEWDLTTTIDQFHQRDSPFGNPLPSLRNALRDLERLSRDETQPDSPTDSQSGSFNGSKAEAQFNLDFTKLENTDVLENFDFDSFLNVTNDDTFNFDGGSPSRDAEVPASDGLTHNGSMAMPHLGPQQPLAQQHYAQMNFGQIPMNPQQQAMMRQQMMQRLQAQQQYQQQESIPVSMVRGGTTFTSTQMTQMKMNMPMPQQLQMQAASQQVQNFQQQQQHQQRMMAAHAQEQAAMAYQKERTAVLQLQLSRSQAGMNIPIGDATSSHMASMHTTMENLSLNEAMSTVTENGFNPSITPTLRKKLAQPGKSNNMINTDTAGSPMMAGLDPVQFGGDMAQETYNAARMGQPVEVRGALYAPKDTSSSNVKNALHQQQTQNQSHELAPEDNKIINLRAAELAKHTPKEEMLNIVEKMNPQLRQNLMQKQVDPIIYYFRMLAFKEFRRRAMLGKGEREVEVSRKDSAQPVAPQASQHPLHAIGPKIIQPHMFVTYTISEDMTGNQDCVMNARLAALASRCSRPGILPIRERDIFLTQADRYLGIEESLFNMENLSLRP